MLLCDYYFLEGPRSHFSVCSDVLVGNKQKHEHYIIIVQYAAYYMLVKNSPKSNILNRYRL